MNADVKEHCNLGFRDENEELKLHQNHLYVMRLHDSEPFCYIPQVTLFLAVITNLGNSDSGLILIWLASFLSHRLHYPFIFKLNQWFPSNSLVQNRKMWLFPLQNSGYFADSFSGNIYNILWEWSFHMDLFNIMLICWIDSYFQEPSCTSTQQFWLVLFHLWY